MIESTQDNLDTKKQNLPINIKVSIYQVIYNLKKIMMMLMVISNELYEKKVMNQQKYMNLWKYMR